MTSLILPYPPSINHYYSRNRNGSVRVSKEGVSFRHEVWLRCRQARVRALAGPVSVSIEVFPPDARRRDLDNTLKSLLDALQHGGVYEDDSQVARLEITRYEKRKGGQVWASIVPFLDIPHRSRSQGQRGE